MPGAGDNENHQITMRTGTELREHGDDLTEEQLHRKVVETVDKMESKEVQRGEGRPNQY